MIGNKSNSVINNVKTTTTTGNDSLGTQIFDTGVISLGSAPINPTIPNEIVSINGKGISALHGHLQVIDTPTSTAPVTPSPLESVIKKFAIQSISGNIGEPIFDFDGSVSEITRWQRIINPNGNYQTSPTPTISTTAVTSDWYFDIYFDIPASLLGVRPILTFNTEGSRATTLNGMTSTAELTLSADYTELNVYNQPLKRSRLKNIQINQSTTGVSQLGYAVDKDVNVIQQAFDLGSDSNLSASNTFNLSIQGNQIMNNLTYKNIVGAESNLYPLGSHISGFFPFRTIDKNTRYFDSSYNLSMNIASAPFVGTGVNEVSNKMIAYLQEQI